MAHSSASLLQSLKADQENWQLRRMAAEALADEGSAPEAAVLVADTTVIPPTEGDLLFAIDLVASVDLARAGAFASQIVEADGDNPEAHVGKAFACWLGGDMETAQAWYQQAQHMQPGFRSGTLEKLMAETVQPPASGTGGNPVAVQPLKDTGNAVAGHQDPPLAPFNLGPATAAARAVPPHDQASISFSPILPSIPVAQAVTAPAVPPPGAQTPPADPQPSLSEEELAALEEADENAHLAELIAHAARNKDTKEKTTALTVAVVLHLFILALLTLVIVAPALMPTPEIVAVTAPSSAETELQKRQFAPAVRQAPSAPSKPVTQVISSAGMSPVVAPTVDFTHNENIDLGSSIGSGIGFGGNGSGIGGGMNGGIKSRCSRPERIALLQKHGGKVEVELAVDRSLAWLQKQQNSDGSWGNGNYKAGMTGFALLCYLGRCETPDSPRYGDTVMNGVMYLVEIASKNNGLFTENPGAGHYVYEHGIATYAMGETYAMSRMGTRRLPGVREAFERGVRIVIDGQTDAGGWLYSYAQGGGGDTSVTGWQFQALRAAVTTQLEFEDLEAAKMKTAEYLERVQGPQGAFGYRGRGDKSTLAGLGALGLQMMGKRDAETTLKAIEFIAKQPDLSWNNIEIYPWYYNTQALFNAGGSEWKKWNDQMLPILLDNQKEDGSWPAMSTSSSGARHSHVGPDSEIYMTAMCTLMLEIYYRYLPAGSDTGTGTRASLSGEFKSRFD